MRRDQIEEDALARLGSLRAFQENYKSPVSDRRGQSPERALRSLRDAAKNAPDDYREYLDEALSCYEGGQYRAAVLMVWAATIQHLYIATEKRSGGVKAIEAANQSRFGTSKGYKEIRKVDDLLYLKEDAFLQLAEDAGMYNRNARKMLGERLDLRNRCAHPTRYRPGREEVVIFIESLLLNIVDGAQMNW